MGILQRNVVALWLLGLFNNSIFVILNAGAKSISAGGVGLVYLFNTFPTLIVQGTGPYWFHLVTYRTRVKLCTALFLSSVLLVASSDVLLVQLIGVGLGSFAQGLGESSILALTSFYSNREVTAWSSGTGAAGIAGYAWKALFTDLLGLSFSSTLVLSTALPVCFFLVYEFVLLKPRAIHRAVDSGNPEEIDNLGQALIEEANDQSQSEDNFESEGSNGLNDMASEYDSVATRQRLYSAEEDALVLSTKDKMRIFASLWPFTIPLCLVYVSEYSMQSGTWAAIGFPVEDQQARDRFYLYSNWLYQVGVFVSRSSGSFITLGLVSLWVMPILQCCLLAFFILDPLYRWWWSSSLLVLCFVTGLFGGAVYVHTYCIMSRQLADAHKEFSMAAASVAATFGTALANVFGLLIQGCLYGAQGITDGGKPPTFKCGYSF